MGIEEAYSGWRSPGTKGVWKRSMIYSSSLAFLLLLSGLAIAAQTTSTVEGAVKDKQGLAVAGVQVRATSAALAVDRTVTTESDGSYRISRTRGGRS